MPGIELHADFDRDGRITRSARERSARLQWPGAIVVPNLDRDRRRLPRTPATAAPPPADYDEPGAQARDDELLPLEIRVARGGLSAGERLVMRCSGIMHTRIRLSDRGGTIVPHRLGSPELFELPPVPANGLLRLTLQARTVAGGSFGRLSSLDLGYREDSREETNFELTLLRRDSAGVEHVEDRGRFSVSPFVLADRNARARLVYIVELAENRPSVEDMRAVLRQARVPLRRVPADLTGLDTWLQDQYQHALLQGSNSVRELVVHLPRLRADGTSSTVTDTTEEFVNSHFRSRNVALFSGLWDRSIPVRSENSGVLQLSFRALENWIKRVYLVLLFLRDFNDLGRRVDSSWSDFAPDDWVEAIAQSRRELQRLRRAVSRAGAAANASGRALFDAYLAGVEAQFRHLRGEFRIRGRGARRTITSDIAGNTNVALEVDTALRLSFRAHQMHSSLNYGGNIESTPPVDGAPLGKIIVGNTTDQDSQAELMDPDLLRLLAKQKKQPIVEIDTSWLDVAHVDEMLSVVPHGGRASGFTLLHASAQAAVELLLRAEQRHRAGRTHEQNVRDRLRDAPSAISARLMDEGSSPVTRMFRGRSWLHVEDPAQSGKAPTVIRPPRIFQRLTTEYGTNDRSPNINLHKIGIVPGVGPVRRYPADLTLAEILWSELDDRGVSSNQFFDRQFLAASCGKLADEFSGIPQLPVPVLFDRTSSTARFQRDDWGEGTTAFSPNMVNLQYINGHLIVPSPLGPRMRTDDAIAVVRETMQALQVPGSLRTRVGRRLVRAHRLGRIRTWIEKTPETTQTTSYGLIQEVYRGLVTEADVIDTFRDSFPGASDAELRRRIIQPNRRHFDASGELNKDFSRFTITDGMVDLFELWMVAVAAELNVRLHFIDSWYYHVRSGEIHCGTNVLRRTGRRVVGRRNVWDAPDHAFRA